SSRRRHTRFSRDWSSDVCSSETHRQRVVRTQPLQKLQVGYGSGRTETGAVARGEAPTKPSQQLAVGITGLLHHPPGAEQTVNQVALMSRAQILQRGHAEIFFSKLRQGFLLARLGQLLEP